MPQGNTLYGVWVARSGDAWAVGEHGTVLYNDAASWFPVSVPGAGAVDLYGVWGSEPNDVWIVGAEGTILHFDGAHWDLVPAPTSYALHHVWGRGAADVWAVGDLGTILHFDGQRWTAIVSGTSSPLNRVTGPEGAPGDPVWITGGHACIECGDGGAVLLRGDARQGVGAIAPAPPTALQSVWVRGSDDVWATGLLTDTSASHGLYHFDGQGWTVGVAPDGLGGDFLVDSANDAWLVRPGDALHFDGQSWTAAQALDEPPVYWDQSIAAAHNESGIAWAVGVGGRCLRLDGGVWNEQGTHAFGRRGLDAVWLLGEDDVYVVADGESGVAGATPLFHFDGARWTPVAPPGWDATWTIAGSWGDTGAMWVAAKALFDGAWANVALYHFDGLAWRAVELPTSLGVIDGIWGRGTDEVWALAEGATLAHGRLAAGHMSWTSSALPLETAVWLRGLSGTIDDAGHTLLAVTASRMTSGNPAIVLIGDGETWRREEPSCGTTRAAAMTSATDIWVRCDLGGSAYMLHHDAAGWSPLSLPLLSTRPAARRSALDFRGVWGSAAQVFAAVDGAMFRYDVGAGVWSLEADLTAHPLFALRGRGADVWAVGENGIVLRRSP